MNELIIYFLVPVLVLFYLIHYLTLNNFNIGAHLSLQHIHIILQVLRMSGISYVSWGFICEYVERFEFVKETNEIDIMTNLHKQQVLRIMSERSSKSFKTL